MTENDLAAALERLPALLEGAQFALVFGSAATGCPAPASDLDLAVMFPRPLEPEERLALAAEIAALVRREVDLVDLRRAGTIVKMQVLRHGRPVVVNDPAALRRFAMYTPLEYHDFKILRRPAEEALLRSVLR